MLQEGMPENLEPIKTGNGVAGQYKTSGGPAYFSLLIADNASKYTLEESVAAAHEKIAQLRKQDSFANKLRNFISSLRSEFTEPKVVRLNDDHELTEILEASMQDGKDAIFACSSRTAYKKACQHMGITRADHLACAEMHAVLIDQNNEKSYVAGSAHKLRDKLLKLRKVQHRVIGTPQEYVAAMIEKFINDIPAAAKFQLGNITIPTQWPDDKPWLFRLPFPKCLFEVEITSSLNSDIRQKAFLLAEEEYPNIFSAHIFYSNKSTDIGMHEYHIAWDVSHKKLQYFCVAYTPDTVEDERAINSWASVYVHALMPFLVQLNDPNNKIVNVVPPTVKRLQFGKTERSPFYDYHILKPEPVVISSESKHEGEPRRLHSRRGHYRTYSHPRYKNLQGQTLWIDAKTWGDESKGVLGKEYDLSND